ncbi:hypothetical protein [Caballeronia sp. GAWG1-5s-s]|uniref:hypothetical protein n=1 Tax=Caballeronia sp. GAWG1-5s-s TaxID=2921743 RepID=UPI002028CC3A|nr:hypothetical protein [Caballeronia sp. GAWG1-5s-s]
MQASQTQIDAFRSLTNREISEAHVRILAVFGSDRAVLLTRDEIAARTGMPVQTICGRVNELLKAEVLAVRDTAKRPGKRNRQQLIGLPVSVN